MLTPSTSAVKVYAVNIVPGDESTDFKDRLAPRSDDTEFAERRTPAAVRRRSLRRRRQRGLAHGGLARDAL
jgi:hypothetical protein